MVTYTNYKSASLPDLEAIPAHWEERRMKTAFAESDVRSTTGDEEMLSVSHITGVTPRSQKNVNMFLSETNVGQKKCQPGDIVINTMWAWMAALGVSEYDGLVSPSYGVYRPTGNSYNSAYLDYLLRTEVYRAEYVRRSTGINLSRLRLYPDRFLSMRFICPPRAKQDQIVRYLDWKVSQVNRLINAKKKQIGLLQEQKRAVIDDALPHEGESVHFRGLFSLVKGLSITKANLTETGIPCVSYGQIHSKYGFEVDPNIHQLPFVSEGYLESNPRSLMNFGDFVFADTSEDIAGSGNFTYLNSKTPVFAGYHTIIARALNPMNYRYIAYYFDSSRFRSQVQQRVNGVKVYSITRSILNATTIELPSEPEQSAAVKFLDQQCSSITELIARIAEEITLLQEYRTRLISDVVTGKLDVRGVALPEYEVTEEAAEDETQDEDEPTDTEEE